jgi:hypothetical protein
MLIIPIPRPVRKQGWVGTGACTQFGRPPDKLSVPLPKFKWALPLFCTVAE